MVPATLFLETPPFLVSQVAFILVHDLSIAFQHLLGWFFSAHSSFFIGFSWLNPCISMTSAAVHMLVVLHSVPPASLFRAPVQFSWTIHLKVLQVPPKWNSPWLFSLLTFSSLLLFWLVNLPSDELAKHAKPFPLQPHRTPSHHLALSSSLLNRPALYPLSLPQLRPPSSFKLYHQFLNRFFSLLSNVTLSAQPLLLVQLPSCQTHQEPFIWRSMT